MKGKPKTQEHRAAIAAALLARGTGLQPKRCTSCGETKERSEFGRRANGQSRADCSTCSSAASRQWALKNPEKVKATNRRIALKRYYGISEADYDAILLSQGGKCAICAVPADEAPKARLSVDHCSETMRIRGLLCSLCNTGIGLLMHDIETLNAAIEYLERTPEPAPLIARPALRCGDRTNPKENFCE